MSKIQTGILLPSEITSLLELQYVNMVENLSVKEASEQGFLTFQYDETFISEMLTDMPQPVARDGELLVAYALATSKRAAALNPLTKTALNLCETLSINDKALRDMKYYILGQVCVKEGYRGKGIFDDLYLEHKKLFSNTYDCIVTEISQKNTRSLTAHKRIGFQVIHSYNDGKTDWDIVFWDWRESSGH
jgi:hypothetical protein